MRLDILGPLAVHAADGRVALGGAVRRRLLAILALERNRTIAAERLAGLLWGDDAPRTAGNTLQVHVAALRRVLASDGSLPGPDRIRTEPAGYRLVSRPGEVDADAFEAGVADARRWAGLDRGRAIELLGDALLLWRGDVLADIALPAELLPGVTGLEARRDAAIDLRLRLRLGSGDPRGVLPDLVALVAADPVNESWIGLQMVALYRAGRQAEALAVFRSARRRLVDDLGLDPSAELRRLELAILRQAPELETDEALGIVPDPFSVGASRGAADQLPAELTTFVGRDDELSTVARLLDVGARLITIVGVGGVGKTRLALRAARASIGRIGDGPRWVDLASAASEEQIAEAIAIAVGIREELEPPFVGTLARRLADRRVLVVLDNCETEIDGAAHVAEALLGASAGLTILATSRAPLGLAAEHVLPIDGLPLPASDERDPATIRGSDAVALFLSRGLAAAPRRPVSDRDLEAVVAVARRLEGLPLGIEMAAAGLRAASPWELADQLSRPGRAVGLSGATTVGRHRTLRAAFETSVERLDGPELAVFRRMAAFAGAVPIAAIDAVCGEGLADVPARVTTLVERSLMVAVPSGPMTRYGLLVPVREYAAELLAGSGELERTYERHLEWAVAVARHEYSRRIADEAAGIRGLAADLADLRAALGRSIGGVPNEAPVAALRPLGQELAGLLGWFWTASGRIVEGQPIVEAAFEGSVGAARGRLLRAHGYIATYTGHPEQAVELLRECVAVWQKLNEPLDHALAFSALGWAYLWPGNNEAAIAAFERGAEHADRIRDANTRPIVQAALLGGIAQTMVAMRDIPRARELGARVLAEAGSGDLRTLHFGHHFLGDCALLERDPATAAVNYRNSLELALSLDDPVEICVELEGLAMAQAGLGREAEAVQLYEAVEAWLDRMGVVIQIPFWRELLELWIGPARASLGSPGEPDGTPLGAAAAVALARSLPTTAPATAGSGR